MLRPGKAVKVSIYLNEGMTYHGAPAHAAILDFLLFRGVSGATVQKAIAGFGADHHLHAASTIEISDKLPLTVEFVETQEKVNDLLGKLQELADGAMIEMQETSVVQLPQTAKKRELPQAEHVKISGKAKLMRIYVGESDKWHDQPLYEALVRAMRAHDLAGVTVYRAIEGYGAHRRVHKDQALRFSRDASMMLSVIDAEEKLNAFLAVVDEMLEEGLVTLSEVDVIKYSHRANYAADKD